MQYHFVGDGAGIIGLPHVISDEEAAQRGPEVVELLQAAIRNGNYAAVSDQVISDQVISDQSSVVSDQAPVRSTRKAKKE